MLVKLILPTLEVEILRPAKTPGTHTSRCAQNDSGKVQGPNPVAGVLLLLGHLRI